MTSFDPAAATAAWLARVPAAAQAQAEHHAQAQALAWGLGLVGPLAIAALLVRSGAVERIWRWGARRGPWAAGLAVVGLTAAAGCAWETFTGAVGGSGWPGVAGFAAAVVVRMLVLAAALGALRLAGGRPRLVLGGLAAAAGFVLVFGPTAMDELRPPTLGSASASVAQAALDVAKASGVAASGVSVSRSAPGEGDVVGLLRPPHLLLTPQAAQASLAEVKAGLGHVLGHYRARDGLGLALVLAGLGAGGVVFVVSGLERLARRRWQWRSHDPCALPILWALAAVWIALAQPVTFAWGRAVNMRADRFSLEHAREPDGLVMALIRENGTAPVDPPLIVRWVVCSHPPLKDRIDQAMRWKADHIR